MKIINSHKSNKILSVKLTEEASQKELEGILKQVVLKKGIL